MTSRSAPGSAAGPPGGRHRHQAPAVPVGSRQAVLRGGSLLIMREALGLVVRSAGLVFLVRLIGTTSYGLYTAPMMIVGLLAAVATCGTDVFLLRAAADDDDWFDAAYAWLLLSSTVLALICAAGAQVLRPEFADARFIPVFQVLVLTLPVNVLWVPAKCRLERSMAFGKIAFIEVFGDVVLYGTSLPLALAGLQQWAPVGGYAAWQTSLLITSLVLAGHRPRLLWSVGRIKKMLGYGSAATTSTLLVRARDALVPVVAGRFGGASGIGVVGFAMRLVDTMGFARRATARLSIVAVGWLQTDRARLRRAIEESMALQTLALGPILAGFAVVSPWLVPHVFGPRWDELIYVFPFLAFGQLAMSVFTMHVSTMFAVGRLAPVIWSNVLRLAMVAGLALPLGWRFGVAGASASVAISALGLVPMETGVRRIVPFSYRPALPFLAMFTPLLCTPFVPTAARPLLALPLAACFVLPTIRHETLAVVKVIVGAMLRRPVAAAHAAGTGISAPGAHAPLAGGSAAPSADRAATR